MSTYNDSDDYNGLPPVDCGLPSSEQMTFEDDVRWCRHWFARLAVCSDTETPCYDLSHGCLTLASLAAKRRRPWRISAGQRDDLFRVIIEARFTIERRASDLPEGVVTAGFDGLLILANHLAESDAERATRHPDVIRDAFDAARILRNLAHNSCLADDIRERAAKRRSTAVADIIAKAQGAAA